MKDLGKNVIEIKFVGPDTIEIKRTVGSNGDYTTLHHSYCEQENFSKETIQECLGHFLDVWEREKLKPHLTDRHVGSVTYGVLGTPTPLTDIDGNQLFVGDQVLVNDVSETQEFHVFPKTISVVEFTTGEFGIMGFLHTSWKNGMSLGKIRFILRKVKSYKDVKHNEVCDDIKYILRKEK